jgi:morphogenetic protein associated with SpoVID
LKALVDANPQLKNPSVLLTGETVYIPDTSPIHQSMTSNSANMASPAQLYPANPNLPVSENIQLAPNVQPLEQMPQAAPPMVEQQAPAPQMPVEEKHAQKPVEEKHVMPPQMPVEEKHAMPQPPLLEAQQYKPMSPPLEAQQYKPMSPPLEAQQYMPKQGAMPYAQPFMQPITQPYSPIQQANMPEQKNESFNVYSSEHLFAQINLPAVEAQGKPDHSYAMNMPAWDYGHAPQFPVFQPYTDEMPTAMSFAPVYGGPKPDCGCGCGGTKQQENLMYYANPAALPQMQQDYYPQTSPYYGSQPMQTIPQSIPMQYPMSMQPPMQQTMPWDFAPDASMGMDAYDYTMPYAFPATYPAEYMMPCYPMSTEMSYPTAVQLPYAMPYPYGNMPHENKEAGRDDRTNIEISQTAQEAQTKQAVKAPRKSTANRPAKPAADDRAVIHQFLQRRVSAEPVKENKSTLPWINY